MCGIHGVYSLAGDSLYDASILRKMGDVTVHRGPDDSGEFVAQGMAFGMRRLSIIDLEGGHQPIPNEDETLWLVCNGEIYNFRQLREDLQSKGHKFRTGSDSEVVLHLYEEYGDSFVKYLNGMFGFALWDSNRRRLVVGRDRLGIKPVYYMQDGDNLFFASELKSILSVCSSKPEIDPVALDQYLALGYVPGPLTMFEGIKKLPTASLMICENGRYRTEEYWNFSTQADNSRSEGEWIDELLEKLETAVESQMVSDVPLGAFLSGGIDSSSIVALMARHSDKPIKTYSIGFDTGSAGQYYNELPYAKQVAKMFNTDHREILVKPDVVNLLPKLIWHMDEPVADAAFITTYLVAEFARQDVTVILSGVGGDELFGGYRRYLGEYYNQYYNILPSWLRHNIVSPLARRLPADRHSPLMNLSRYARSFILSNDLSFEDRYRSYVQVFNRPLIKNTLKNYSENGFDALGSAFTQGEQGDALGRLFQVDFRTQLPDDLLMLTDKMTMATSIECRVPLLDHELVELAAHMPSRLKIRGRTLKYILKKALKGILPDEVLFRKKRGFGAPMGAWLKKELFPLMSHLLSRQSMEQRGIFDWQSIDRIIQLHQANKEDHTDHLQSLMNFEIWCRLYLDNQSPHDLSEQMSRELSA